MKKCTFFGGKKGKFTRENKQIYEEKKGSKFQEKIIKFIITLEWIKVEKENANNKNKYAFYWKENWEVCKGH